MNCKKISAVLLALCCVFIFFTSCGKNGIQDSADSLSQDSDNASSETTYAEYPDVDNFIRENAEVQSIVAVPDSTETLTEKDIVSELNNRGFSDVLVETSYDMNGNYSDGKEISEKSDAAHPMYSVLYQNSHDELWNISIINGQFLATPLSYTYQSNSDRSVLISESNTVTSYDSHGNRFYVSVPNEDYMKVIVVDAVNASTLDNLTVEVLEQS